jgi:PAS domain-containing protein
MHSMHVDAIGPFAESAAGLFFLLACLTAWLLFRLRSVVKRSAVMTTENRALRESEERYRTIVTATPEMILICRNGLADYINASGAAMLGARSADLILARPVIELLGGDTAAAVRNASLRPSTRADVWPGARSGCPGLTDRHSAPNSPGCRWHLRAIKCCC